MPAPRTELPAAGWRHLWLAAASLLAGCTVLGPDYREPSPDWLAAWQPSLYGQLAESADAGDAAVARWWRLFEDPALDGIIEEVLVNNRSLQVAGLRVLEARAQLGAASALNFPQLQRLDASALYVDQRRSGGLLPDRDDSLVAGSGEFSLAWELDFWGRFRRGIEAADAAFLASIANQRDAQVLLVAQTADAYYAYRTTELRIEIARENARIQERSLEITRQLYDSGQESELDLQQARTQYLSTIASIPALQADRIQLRNLLALLLGRPPGAIAALASPSPSLPALPPVALRAVPAELLLRRPDVRRSAWSAAAESARVGIAQADLYPSLSLLGSFGVSGDTLDSSADLTQLALGPAIRWNIFDYGRLRNAVRSQDARLQQALVAFDNTLLSAAREIDDAAIDVVRTAERKRLLAEAEDAARRALSLANDRYREGYAGFQRVLDAQRALAAQMETRLLNEASHLAAVIALYKALGGGWESAESMDQLIPPDQREALRARVNWADQLEAELPRALEGAAMEETP
jgi:NodT family efflux transporter outer membrane factor (OMF) lipoprotein